MTSSRKKKRRGFGFEVLEVRRLLTGQPGTISGAILENPVVGVPLTISGVIDDPSHGSPNLVDLYQVHLSVGQQLSANVSVLAMDPTPSAIFQSYLRVLNSAPSEVKNSGFGFGDSSVTYTAIASGDYYVGVSDGGTSYDGIHPPDGTNAQSFGAYDLTLLVSPPVSDANNSIATATPIGVTRGVPTTLSGAIAYPNDADLFKMSLLKNDHLSLAPQAIGSPLAGRLRLFETSPHVQEFAPNTFSGGDPSLTYTIPETGVYYVGISDSSDASYDPNVPHVPHDPPAANDALVGAFSFSVTASSPAPVSHETEPDDSFDDANSLSMGTSVGGTINGVGDQDFYLFTLTSSGLFTATATPTASPSSPLAPRLTLYSLDRQPLVSADGSSGGAASLQQHLPAGTYYLTVSSTASTGADQAASGDYDLATTFTAASDPFSSVGSGAHSLAIARPDANSGLLLDSHGRPIIDLNGDGIPDLVVANQFSSNVSVMFGVGDGTFQPAVNYQADAFTSAVAVGDFNHDGHEDVAAANYFTGDVSIFLNNGDGTLQPAVNYTVGGQPLALAIGDFSGNGHLDIAVATADAGGGAGSVVILTGDGHGNFTTGNTIAVGVRPYEIVAARFGHDQFLDLAVANRNSDTSSGSSVALGPGTVSILRGDGQGGFQTVETDTVGNQPTSIAAGDLNGDGLTDLAVANAENRSVSLMIGQANGTFAVQPELNFVGEAISINAGGNDSGLDGFRSTVIMADFNGDGRLDLALANSLDPRVRVALQNADGSFAAAQAVDVGGISVQPQDLLAADFSGNGRVGLAAVDGFGGAVTVRLGLGDGTFQVPRHFDVGNEPSGLVAVDFNHDGRQDLAAANDGPPGGASVLMGLGDGTFQQQTQFTTGISSSIASADFNGDGRPDIVTTNYDPETASGDVTVLLGLGDGTFQSAVHYAAGDRPFAVVTGDFNGDGRPDIAVVNQFSNNVSIFLNNGDGTFQAAVNYHVGAAPDAIAVGDFNGDHHLDLAVANSGSNDVTILLGDGHGAFQAMATTLTVGTSPSGIVVGDFGNGHDDIATSNSGSGDVSVLMNLGGGAFAPATNLTASSGPSSIAIGDFNGDGVKDLAVSNALSDTITVFIGQGGGAFAAGVSYAVGHNPQSLVAADLNGDGRTDLACVNFIGRDVSVLLGRGDGTFVTPDKFSANAITSTPTLADVTGDGVLDSIALDGAGQILLRPGRKSEPGAYDAARIVNPNQPARSFTVVRSGGRNLIAAVDLDANAVSLYATSAAGISTLARQLSTDLQPVRIAAASLRNNGLQDLVVANAGSGDVSVFLAKAGGGFNAAVTFAATDHPTELSLVALDGLNGDQLPDIVVSDAVAGTVTVLVNQASGNFAPAVHYRATTGQAGFSVDTAGNPALLSADGAGSFAWGDFFGNNRNDLVIVNAGDDSLSLLEGDGRGGFLNPVRLLAGVKPAIVRAGHFFLDGHLDLAVLDADHHTITILRGDGHGNFQATGQYDAGNLPDGLLVGDFDGNGTSDLIVGNQFGDVMSLTGLGNGTFDPFTRVGQQIAIAVGDVTGNGLQSWVVTDQTRDHLVMQVGGTTPSFSQGRSNGVISPGAAKLVDLNGDHILDMVVANSGGNDVLVYEGLGNGQFAAPVAFYAGTDPVDVQVGNVDGNPNHLPDVIITNKGSNDVSILLNNVSNSSDSADTWLRPGPRLNVGLAPVSAQLVASTLPGGLPSLMVTNSGSNNVSMLPGLGGGFFNDVTPTLFNTGNSPQAAFIGNFFGLGQALVTVNYLSNSLTVYRGMNPNSRQDIGSGGLGPSAAVTADFAQNGGLELVVANSIDGAVAIFAGTANGLIETDAIFSESLQHPVALALAAPGEGQGLRLLAADEGDENVRVFSRETVLQPSPADIQLATTDSAGTPFGFSALSLIATALGIAVESGITSMADNSVSPPTAGGASAKVSSLRDWLETTVATLASSTHLHDASDGAIDVLESVLDVAAPQVPWRVLHQFFETLLHAADGSKKAAAKPAVVDQVFETGGDDDGFDVEGDLPPTDVGNPPTSTDRVEDGGDIIASWPDLDRNARLVRADRDAWSTSRDVSKAEWLGARGAPDRREAPVSAASLGAAPGLRLRFQPRPCDEETTTADDAASNGNRLIPEVVAAVFAAGFAVALDYSFAGLRDDRRNRFGSLRGTHDCRN